ncbi:hypothetical protein ACS0TY_024236 [Phlomoides rotata]
MITAPSISIDQLPSPSADASSQPATPAHRHPRRLPIQHHRKPPRRPYFCRFAPPRPQRTRRPVLLFVASPCAKSSGTEGVARKSTVSRHFRIMKKSRSPAL